MILPGCSLGGILVGVWWTWRKWVGGFEGGCGAMVLKKPPREANRPTSIYFTQLRLIVNDFGRLGLKVNLTSLQQYIFVISEPE